MFCQKGKAGHPSLTVMLHLAANRIVIKLAMLLPVLGFGLLQVASAAEGPRNELLEPARFIQIPGPNPIVTPGPKGAWDGDVVEAADAFKDYGTYYLYYHGNAGHGYQLGVATAPHPLGPFTKHGTEPVLKRGPKGGWEDEHVACAMILKEGTRDYLMWYSGMGSTEGHRQWSIGLARAESPLGPWKKFQGNPIIKDFGYVGGVVKHQGKYWLYTAHPIDSTGPDYSPMALATAEKPEGPWKLHPGNPVVKQGEWGEWDDGGFSEAEVLYHSGVWHMFYGGAKLFEPRIVTRESIGYAYSFDGIHFTKYGRNPVATRDAEPNASAYAEVHAILEPPFVYLYHTLRYREPWRERFKQQFPVVEDLGVQVLVMQRPFKLDMPVINCKKLGPKQSIELKDCPPIPLDQVERVALTVEGTFSEKSQPPSVFVHASHDGLTYDNYELQTFRVRHPSAGKYRQTFELNTGVRFIKLRVTNHSDTMNVTDLKITATLGG